MEIPAKQPNNEIEKFRLTDRKYDVCDNNCDEKSSVKVSNPTGSQPNEPDGPRAGTMDPDSVKY